MNSDFIFFKWRVTCLSWDEVEGWLERMKNCFILPCKELITPLPFNLEPGLFRNRTTYFYLSICVLNRERFISKLPKDIS